MNSRKIYVRTRVLHKRLSKELSGKAMRLTGTSDIASSREAKFD